jgi:transcriptional regulator of acetoin/glycerol metabolism
MNEHSTPAQHQGIQTKDTLAVLIAETYSSGIFYSEFVRETKKRFIAHVLRACNGNQCRAAIELGMHRNTLSRTIAELNLRRDEWDPRRQLAGRFPAMSSGARRARVA